MTLNITVLTENVVYQSADFRLWNPNARKLETDSSTKIVTIRGWEWQGTLTYTGIGREGRLDTSKRIINWLTGHSDLSFEDTVELIRSKGSAWLRQVDRQTGQRWPHTFVLAGFQSGPATAAVISNFEDASRERTTSEIKNKLVSSFVSFRSKPEILVTGCVTPIISRRQRRLLERLARDYGNDPARIRCAMQELNRQAAKIGGPSAMISKECAVQSFDRAGRGQQSGLATGAHLRELMDGTDLGNLLEQAVRQLFPDGRYEMRGATSVTSKSQGSPTDVCSPQLSMTATAQDYELIELSPDNGLSAVARGVTQAGLVIGECSRVPGGPVLPVRWTPTGDAVFFDDLGGITGQALAINDHGISVGTVEDGARWSHACQWDRNFVLNPLIVDGATHSGARGINNDGDVVGWASFHPTDGGQKHFRPVLWRHDGAVQVMRDIPAEWGEAVAVNSRREVLISAHDGRRAVPILWQGDNITPLVETGQYMIGVGLDAMGRVLGWTRDNAGQARAMIWTVEKGWALLDTPPDWHVTAISADGVIVGFVDETGFRRPWILKPGSGPKILPHFAYHFNQVNGISNGGVLCGTAASDHGNHALVWSHTN